MMKKITYFAAVAAVATAGLTACGNKAKSDITDAAIESAVVANPMAVTTNAVTDTTITLNGMTADYVEVSRIFPVDKDGQFFLSVRAIVPEANTPVTDSLYKSIAAYYSLITDTVAPDVAPINSVELIKAVDELGAGFTDVAKVYAADSIVYGYQMTAVVEPVYHADKVLTYSVYEDSYTGGAHGDVNSYYVSYNPTDGSQYTFETLVKPDKQKAVRKMLVESIAAQKEMTVAEYLTSVSDFMGGDPLTIETFPIYNVGITNDGLVFAYPKYTIAAGFEGCPTYAIAFDDIAGDLEL